MPGGFERKMFGVCADNLRGVLYVAGGDMDAKITNVVQAYDLKAKRWSQLSQLNTPVRKNSLVLFNYRYLLSIGGQRADG